jgi:signal peptidase II
MMLGEEYNIIGDWFIIHFTENEGMAFGWGLPGKFGKLFLTLFRIVAVVFIGYFLRKLIQSKAYPKGFIVCMSLIFAGAIGNIIDSLFYGMIFDESYYNVATLFPEGGGYASLFHGKVVDMFYFPIIQTHYPNWFPVLGGQQLIFFRPVFNVADSAISVGVITLLVFYRKYLKEIG